MKYKYYFIIVLFMVFNLSLNGQSNKGAYIEKYVPGHGISIKSYDNSFGLNMTGVVQSSFEVKNSMNNDYLSGRYRIRRARLQLKGDAFQEKLSWRIKVDFSLPFGNSPEELNNGALLDAFIAYRPTSNVKITFGQRSQSTDNREMRMSSERLEFVERSKITSAFASIRDFGFFIETRHTLRKDFKMKTYIDIVSGDGQNGYENFGGLKYGGRINLYPTGYFRDMGELSGHDFAHEWKPKIAIGAAYSYNQGVSSRRGRQSGDILYLDENDNYVLPDYQKLVLDFQFKYRGFSALGIFVKSFATVPDDITQRVRNDGSASSVFQINGEDVPVEDYVKNRMMLGSGFNFQCGYLFDKKYGVDFRYTKLIADEYSFINNAKFYDRPEYYTVGFSNYFSQLIKLQLSVTYNSTGDDATYVDAKGDAQSLEGVGEMSTRLIFQIKF